MSESFELGKKYLGQKVLVIVDRPLGSKHPKYGFEYVANYGYLEGVQAPDGEELDAYYLGVEEPLTQKEGVCIAVVHRLDDDDDKLVVAPEGTQLTDEQIELAIHFQEQWFKHEIMRNFD